MADWGDFIVSLGLLGIAVWIVILSYCVIAGTKNYIVKRRNG